MIEATAYRRGLGDLLAEGSVRLAAQLGSEASKYLYAVKGLEMPAHSARVLKGMSLGYATATRGGSHHDTRPTLQYATDHDNTTPEGKPEFAVKNQHFTAVGDALTQCRFVSERGFGGMLNDNYPRLINSVTGWNLSLEDVERIGVESSETAAKAKAMGLLQSYANKGTWEPEAKRRANEAVAAIQNSMK